MHPFLMGSTLGRGTVPWLPEEMRRMIFEHVFAPATPCALTCRSCPRVLCYTTFRSASSYQSLADASRVCLECYSEAPNGHETSL